MGMLELFTGKDGSEDGGPSGIMGMVKKFQDSIANAEAAAQSSLQMQGAILAELRQINVHLARLNNAIRQPEQSAAKPEPEPFRTAAE